MKRHSFNQSEVMMLEKRIGENFKRQKFTEFMNIANELGFKVRVTGGNFLTHDINGSEEDFNTLLEIMV